MQIEENLSQLRTKKNLEMKALNEAANLDLEKYRQASNLKIQD